MSSVNFFKKFNGACSHRIALVHGNSMITYDELWDQVDRLAIGLRHLGLQRLDRVALALPNSITWIVSFLATLRAGGVAVPLRYLATPFEIKRFLVNSKPTIMIADFAFVNRSLPFNLLRFNRVDSVVLSSKRLMTRGMARRITYLNDILKECTRVTRSEVEAYDERNESEPTSISYTYRGYGYPLGAVITHRNYFHGIDTYVRTTGLHEGHRFLLTLPLSHVYGLVGCLLTSLALGGTIVIPETPTSANILKSIQHHSPDVLTGVPYFFSNLLRSAGRLRKEIGTTVEHAFCGGSLMPLDLYKEVKYDWGISLRQGYGLTETLPITCNPPSKNNKPETVGKVGLGVSVRVVEEDRTDQPLGVPGEILVSGPTVMSGYHGMPDETSMVLRDGWFHTGDVGWFDEDGYLHFESVRKRITKVASNMVDLTEIEQTILAYPGVLGTRVYTVPDEIWGQVVAADVTCENGQNGTREIKRHLRNRLTSYKVPRIRLIEA
jgi:acyl-CoA synthetase (AMP-forming)/AMP-acid ligase II